jgi:perosamine synthetase
VHEELGWNMRMTNLQAALGVAQLERWNEFIGIKKKMGKLYTYLLKDEKSICIPVEKTAYAENMYWVFGVISENKDITAEMLMKKLADKGIGTRPFFYPMHLQPAFKKMNLFVGESYPNAEKMYKYGFYLPSGLALTETQIQEVAKTLKSVLN